MLFQQMYNSISLGLHIAPIWNLITKHAFHTEVVTSSVKFNFHGSLLALDPPPPPPRTKSHICLNLLTMVRIWYNMHSSYTLYFSLKYLRHCQWVKQHLLPVSSSPVWWHCLRRSSALVRSLPPVAGWSPCLPWTPARCCWGLLSGWRACRAAWCFPVPAHSPEDTSIRHPHIINATWQLFSPSYLP